MKKAALITGMSAAGTQRKAANQAWIAPSPQARAASRTASE